MRRLVDELVAGVGLPVPAEPDALFDALIRVVGAKTGRELLVLRKEFPHRTASGLWLDLPDLDVIVIDERATPLHQLAIFFHEVWHLLDGACGNHTVGQSLATRMLATRPDLPELDETVRRVAARTEFKHSEERAAEMFGLLATTRFRVWLESEPGSVPTGHSDIAGRINASLGNRRRQV
ncbi:toxin-antitoxin system, toxin component [Streptomyces sp. NPDC058751]|uniref:toxin-antitoxin system, toxin component n=1 Tax=Streptomyces sp. NPDC058751 TaxID=3346623 RepID=UPI0036759D87